MCVCVCVRVSMIERERQFVSLYICRTERESDKEVVCVPV